MRKLIVLIAAVVTMACSTVPSGYTPEAWERLQRDYPNQAQAIKWIEKDVMSSLIRKIYIKEWQGNVELADGILVRCAEPEMIQGKPGAFKAMVREMTILQINKGVTPNQSQESLDRKKATLKTLDAL